MNKRTASILLGIALCILVICALATRCSSPSNFDDETSSPTASSENDIIADADVVEIVDSYNSVAQEYNLAVIAYNDSVQQLTEANAVLEEAISAAQAQLDVVQIPFDSKTQDNLENVISSAKAAIQPIPELLSEVEIVSVPENANSDELQVFCNNISAKYEELTSFTWPTPIEVPDYTTHTTDMDAAVQAYLVSVRIMQQVTAPEDSFVIERLKGIDTILSLAAVTSNNDPNKLLGKEGGYIGCIYFSDSRVDKTQLKLDPDEYDVISMGAVGGGAVEIYRTPEDAIARNEYLAQYDGTSMDPGSHTVIGTIVIRTSSKLSEENQAALETEIIEVLTWLDPTID